jgi:hypothetical protein
MNTFPGRYSLQKKLLRERETKQINFHKKIKLTKI